MKYLQWILLALCGFFAQQEAEAQSLEQLRSLGNLASGMGGVKVPGLGRVGRSTANSASDPIFGKARIEARGYLEEAPEYWPWKVTDGYIARDKTGCPFFYANGESRFVYSMDRFEEKVDGRWVELDKKKLAAEVPRHCTGGGG
ncbi:hypothetical protein LQ564_12825 [Massilia sp. G4R7]|uniref:Secreted protein n=1 Tax=Massilia phyllostachyos TaxID=2898585 RepID=A0ABS8Q620_9BURK|nr:hypothetical protein [Massilia phyllostachyos]MCD2517191.1 hypothetical protein [Massilia phyllostachyos]